MMKTMKLLFLALVFLSFNLGKTEAQIVISYDKERDSPVRIDNAEVIIDGVTYKFHTSVINVKYDASGTVPTEFTITDGYFEVTGYNDNQASEVNLLKEFATRSGDGAIGRGYVTFSLAAGTSGFIRFLDDEGEEVNELSPEIVFPVTIYPDDLFRNKENLTSVTIHDNFTKIPAYYFQGCTNLQHVELPNTITSIGYAAFRDLVNLTGELHLPSSLKSIGNYAFYGCSGLTGNLTIPKGVTTIGNCAFYGCSGFTGSLTIPEGVTTIGGAAFSGCSGFTDSLTIPEGVTTIGNSAFYGCSGFTGSLTIPDGVTTIGSHAFWNCSGFTGSLTIPEGVTTIEVGAFFGCSGFTGSLTIPEGVTTIGSGAFSGCSGFTGSLTIPEGVTTIGNSAFGGCSGFTGSLTIPEGVTTIGNDAFYRCSGFTGSLTIPEGVTTIGSSTFYGCSGFTGSLTIPEGVTTIGRDAFYGCSGFTGSLTIPEGVTTIGVSAFSGCSGFTGSLTIPEGVTTIGNYAFLGFNVTHVISKIQEPFQCSPWNTSLLNQAKLIVPTGTRDAYLATADWNKFSQITEAVVLEETSTEEPMAINDVNVWMERTIKADEWSTICLPFAMTAEQVKATFGEDVELGDFAGYEITKDVNDQVVGLNVKFNDATAIQANHPYIIKVTNDVSNFLVEEVNVTPVENPVYAVVERTATEKSEFVGTYVAETVVPSDALFLSGNKFWYSTGLTKMKAFRAYFDFYDILPEVEGAGAPVFISFGGETTRLDQLNIDGEDSNYYDLNGRVVKTPQKGVYIRNGKKVIVK